MESGEAVFGLLIVLVVIFALLGIAYAFVAATVAIQRICQRHYHILTKRELTKGFEGFLRPINDMGSAARANRWREREQNPTDFDPLLEGHDNWSPESSSEIRNVDVESGSTPCCRICFESDVEPGNELISPCMCKGTMQFVHSSCLDHWRSVKEGFAFSHCTTCKAQFHLRVETIKDSSWRKLKFKFFVARDVFLVFLAVQTVIAAFGGFAYLMDHKDGPLRNPEVPPIRIYYSIGVLAFLAVVGFVGLIIHCRYGYGPRMDCYCGGMDCSAGGMEPCASGEACLGLLIVFVVIFAILGIVYGLFAATMAMQRIWQRHYHILAKRELTQEFIVEDLHGCYTPPKLDPKHEARLKKLKLW